MGNQEPGSRHTGDPRVAPISDINADMREPSHLGTHLCVRHSALTSITLFSLSLTLTHRHTDTHLSLSLSYCNLWTVASDRTYDRRGKDD